MLKFEKIRRQKVNIFAALKKTSKIAIHQTLIVDTRLQSIQSKRTWIKGAFLRTLLTAGSLGPTACPEDNWFWGQTIVLAKNRAWTAWSRSPYPSRRIRLLTLPCSRPELAVQSPWTGDSYVLCGSQDGALAFHLRRTWRHVCYHQPTQEQNAVPVTERDRQTVKTFVSSLRLVSADSQIHFICNS